MKDLIVSFLGTGLLQLANIVSGVLAARLLLPEGRGELAAVILWVSIIATVGCLGIDQAVTYFTASRRQHAFRPFGAGMLVAAVLAAASVAAGFVILPLIFVSYSAEVIAAAHLYLLFIPFMLVGMVIMAFLRGTGWYVEWNVLRILKPLAYVTGIVLFYAVGTVSVRSFLVASLLSQCALISVGLLLIFRRKIADWLPRVDDLRPFLRYSLGVYVGSLTMFAGQRLDQALISLYLPPTQLGFYVVALTLPGGVGFISGTMSVLAFPKIAGQGTPEGKALVFGRYTKLSLFLSAGAAGVLYALAPWLIEVFFGSPFLQSVEVARVVLVATILASWKMLIVTGLKAYGHILVVNKAELLGLVVTVVCLMLLLPRFGLMGAAWTVVIAQLATGLYLAAKIRGELGISAKRLALPTLADWEFLRARLNELRGRV